MLFEKLPVSPAAEHDIAAESALQKTLGFSNNPRKPRDPTQHGSPLGKLL